MRWDRSNRRKSAVSWVSLVIFAGLAQSAQAQRLWPLVLPEQRTIQVRDPSQLPQTPVVATPNPPTVADPQDSAPALQMSLDDVLRISLGNSEVVRVLAGTTAVSSGSTVYDAAVTNTTIDQQRARFDPTISAPNTWNRNETPTAIVDPLDPNNALITGFRTDNYNLNLNLQQTNVLGGTTAFNVFQNPTRGLFPLNPQNNPSLGLGYTQPLLAGAGVPANVAPIVIARIDTERSYFQFKDSMQDMVRGVIEAYWNVVNARVDVWARRQQLQQSEEAYERTLARFRAQIADAADVAQTRVTWENFRATLIGSEANLLQREAALLNILGLPPSYGQRFIPVTPPTNLQFTPDWNATVALAAQRRPDIVELKLILEADEQQIIIANNRALPQADAILQYNWNGLFGRTPDGRIVNSLPGQFTDWTLGVNFSVPIGLRQGRAVLRQRQLLLSRDQANLEQGLHSMNHILAANLRNLARAYEQYLAFKETRQAARINLTQQSAEYYSGRTIFLNVLQAITSWGDAVINEANSVAQYNIELANLERETGTILESHGIRFAEERFGSIGPLGRLAVPRPYPERLPPTENSLRYERGERPSENWFDLSNPAYPRRTPPTDELPLPDDFQSPVEAIPPPPIDAALSRLRLTEPIVPALPVLE